MRDVELASLLNRGG